jgi:succinate dehydrogenase/fumarate reductase cytochrome b subunit
MAGNTQIDPKTEGGLFSLMHGITGYLVAVVLLLSILGTLTFFSITTQAGNATKYYQVNTDLNALKFSSADNNSYRTMK